MSKQIYPSKYTDRKVTAAQFLCDEICERIAKKEKKVLTYKYWNDSQWNAVYRRQIKSANELLHEVDCVAIMTFLRSVKGRNIYSLGLKKQIIAGAKSLSIYTDTSVTCEQNLNDIVVDDFIEDIPDEEIITSEPKASLWEKLG